MMTMTPPTAQPKLPAAADSDDEDVAFAYMDFNGVDFGEDTNEMKVEQSQCAAVMISVVDEKKEVSSDPFEEENHERADSMSSEANHENDNANDSKPIPINEINNQKTALASIFICDKTPYKSSNDDKCLRAMEQEYLLSSHKNETNDNDQFDASRTELIDVSNLFRQLKEGAYADMLRSPVAEALFGSSSESNLGEFDLTGAPLMMENIKLRALNYCSNKATSHKSLYTKCLELELIGVASLNLFLQLNYTGPSMDRGLKPEEGEEHCNPLHGIHPHGMFDVLAANDERKIDLAMPSTLVPISEDVPSTVASELTSLHSLKERTTSDAFHNVVLSELASDGEWPFQVCRVPYFLLLARSLLSMLADPTVPFRNWGENASDKVATPNDSEISNACVGFSGAANNLVGAALWNARAIVAHRRLITVRRDDDDGSACPTLWKEAEAMFERCLTLFCERQNLFQDDSRNSHVAGSVMLEWGLAQHHFRKAGRGKASFNRALGLVKLEVEVTGAEGKRTKYQQVCSLLLLRLGSKISFADFHICSNMHRNLLLST